jgi:hypothetical protein
MFTIIKVNKYLNSIPFKILLGVKQIFFDVDTVSITYNYADGCGYYVLLGWKL